MLFSVIAHEYAHGYAALKQGDTTALSLGRLTWNPIKHIDPWLTILLPLILYKTTGMALGGAKPVPVDPRNYRNFKRGDIIVSLAGVATNLLLAVVCAVLAVLFGVLGHAAESMVSTIAVAQAMMFYGVLLNLGLFVFNLLPVPPLDGSHVMKYLLPPAWAVQYQRVGFAGIIVLILLMRFNVLNWWFKPVEIVMTWLLATVSRLVLPETQAWFR